MAGNSSSGQRKICDLSADQLEIAWYDYLAETDARDRAPSLPDYLGYVNRKHRTRMTEDTIREVMTQTEGNTYKEHIAVIKCVLMALRGEYLSNPKWSAAQTTKAVLALGKDYGDGITYSTKDSGKQGPDTIQIKFGDAEMSQGAGK